VIGRHRSEGRPLDDRDFRRLAALIHGRSGIRMPPSKKTFLEGRMRRHMRRRGFGDVAEYCRWLFSEGGLAEDEDALIDAVTTNKTEFFRERHHFDFLAAAALPALGAQGSGTERPLRIWSAGCSNGAEPYSLAMACADFAGHAAGFRFEILASDISVTMLQQAMRAVYPAAAVAPVPLPQRRRYLLRDDASGEVRIAPELRRTVRFVHHNLMNEPYPAHRSTDIVVCRNLLIYFDRPTQRDVLNRLCRHVRPGGYLILGHSEGVVGLTLPLRAVAPTTFLREAAG
jgi:chemotaxis protein methyltransferase CheR